MPLTDDRQPYQNPFVLPPTLQDRHLFVIGDTGSGKSVLTTSAMLSNVEATDGPEILFDYKGGGTAEEYLQAHYTAYDGLEDVSYFDLTEILPALSIFDIRPLLDSGLSREEARSRIAGHYEEILAGLMGEEQYYGATESTKAIRNHLRALYDPIHGTDAVSHKDLYRALQRTLSDRTPPPTSDERLTEYFAGLLERDRDVFNMVLGGAVARVEIIATDDRLAPLFDHVYTPPESDESNESDEHETIDDSPPHFDFTDVIDDDTVVIFDFGGMEERIKRALTLVLLSNLWIALKARSEAQKTSHQQPPRVNLYLEEAKDIAATQLVDTLLSQGRSFGLSLMLGVQFPGQLDSPDPSNHTYEEALNEIGTFVVGNVSIEDDLAKALATDDVPPRNVARRLAAIRHGEWLVRPAATFGSPAPRPFLGRSLPAPDGHPASETPLGDEQYQAFNTAFELTALETWNEAGLKYESNHPSTESGSGDEDTTEEASLRVDSLLPHTKRLPEYVSYDESIHALCCGSCENRYDPTIEGMKRSIECCRSLTEVEPDDIPVCDINLKLTAEERDLSDWSDRQLLFLQTVYNAQQLRYDPLEYDLLHDSMIRLQEYVGIETDEIAPLLEADLLRHDTDHPHRLYTVSSEGRSTIGESYRKGVDYGHGVGDLDESSEHILGVEVARKHLEEAYAEDPQSEVTEVIPYYELDDQHRLDLAGVDADGEIIVTAEVERINHDVRRAVPADFDKMAACEPEAAIWVVMKQADGHKILSALNDPLEGPPRIEKTYAKTTPPQQFRIDTPGMTAVYPAEWLRDRSPDLP
ncbi:ATP-binding protein [Haloarchaeobius amylolyticus]|uniref:ATP-binding protein n=1 Tax=Haloarchaeobius amylolyticus TaxID=1198296 RepID=A0ABD6BCQ6_9EURY